MGHRISLLFTAWHRPCIQNRCRLPGGSAAASTEVRRMPKKKHGLTFFLATSLLLFSTAVAEKKKDNSEAVKGESTGNGPALLWREPADIASRNLFYGLGGEAHQPHGPFTFVKEEL